MSVDYILKTVQIIFYITACIIAVLTYVKAKNGLLNAINTEYQKKALIKVEEISNFLISEFDENSENHWFKNYSAIEDCVKTMLDDYNKFIPDKETSFEEWPLGFSLIPFIMKSKNWLDNIKSDPFIPKTIRTIVIDYLGERIDKMETIHVSELEKFGNEFIKDPKKFINIEDTADIIYSRIVQREYVEGCGKGDVEKKIHELRNEIQRYYERYDPFK